MVLISRPLKKHAALLAASLLALAPVAALDVPAYTSRVIDDAGIISSSEKNELNAYLESLEDTTGIQIAVLTVPSLQNDDLETYSIKVTQAWKLGQKGKDNGALLLVAVNEHKVRIEVGYGLEDKLTDAKCGLIIRNVITPKFRTGDYGKGIISGVKNMGGIASDNAELVDRSVANGTGEEDNDVSSAIVFAIIFFIVWCMILPNIAGRRSRWFPWLILPFFGSSGSHHHDSFGDSGGFGGSHFSGGGGGSFGGGGASGGW